MKELKHLTRFLLLIACASLLIGTASACYNECLSPGYWKNHEDWPGDSITIGYITYYQNPECGKPSYEDARELMCQPVKGDKSVTLFKALVAAKLNQENNCYTPCVVETAIEGANCLIAPYSSSFEDQCVMKANSDKWQGWYSDCGCWNDGGEYYYEILDAYNNGEYDCDD